MWLHMKHYVQAFLVSDSVLSGQRMSETRSHYQLDIWV
ncbi:hypothetical protein F383_07014 [Gossypium arboreum]|uniref:Uncharacterized protein n=1 Tax=Gossypium arboreum TaxID=29729 RepID=A0A0B0NYY9_GOSAR|nr:hypothetical protein F383_07014 [Gossypium arboreum]